LADTSTGLIYAQANGAAQFGAGTNNTANSLQIGSAVHFIPAGENTIANDTLITAKLTLSNELVATPDEITATSEGVAASIVTLNTEVTTNGDSDLDNVTLANGTSGQVKHIYCVVGTNTNDSWKITPAVMVGGTQITFAAGAISPAGLGCTLVYANNEGWCVVANNGGIIT